MSETKRIGILKTGRLGFDLVTELNAEGSELIFVPLRDEQAAIDAINTDSISLIVSGVVGIDWEGVYRQVGKDRLIIYSAEVDSDELDAMMTADVSFVRVNRRESIERLLVVIKSKLPRE